MHFFADFLVKALGLFLFVFLHDGGCQGRNAVVCGGRRGGFGAQPARFIHARHKAPPAVNANRAIASQPLGGCLGAVAKQLSFSIWPGSGCPWQGNHRLLDSVQNSGSPHHLAYRAKQARHRQLRAQHSFAEVDHLVA